MRRVLIALVIALLPAAATAQPRALPQSVGQIQLSFAPIVKKVAPAVVNVYARRVVRQASPFFQDPLFQQFFGGQERARVEQSLGSGVIVRPDGVIVTNNHVIKGAQDIRVALPDRRQFEAKVILADARTDLAVLKIDTKGDKLPSLQFGDSDNLQVGDLVLAIGDPFGVGQTVTSGIVSALARTQVGASDYKFFIQTDAAINPGNSGGALVAMDGKLVGINSSILSSSGGNIGIGFAIPSNMVRQVVEGALGGGIHRPWLGAQGQAVTGDIASSLGLSRPSGVVISEVYPGSPAAKAGIKRGDVVLSIDGFAINDPQGLNYRVGTRQAGDMVKVAYIHDGDRHEVSVRVSLPPDRNRDETTIDGRNPMNGTKVANVTPALADQMQMDYFTKGVVVTNVQGGSQADRFGFQQGDLIRKINGHDIHTVAGLRDALQSARGWNMSIQRGNQMLSLSIN